MFYTDAYLQGISEGRALLKSNPDFTIEDFRRCFGTAQVLTAQRQSGPMQDHYRGERDFWKNQIKLATK